MPKGQWRHCAVHRRLSASPASPLGRLAPSASAPSRIGPRQGPLAFGNILFWRLLSLCDIFIRLDRLDELTWQNLEALGYNQE